MLIIGKNWRKPEYFNLHDFNNPHEYILDIHIKYVLLLWYVGVLICASADCCITSAHGIYSNDANFDSKQPYYNVNYCNVIIL